MHIVITGGSGAIGQFVVEAVRDRGHDVTVFDITAPEPGGVAFVQGDITASDVVRETLVSADAVIHLAALMPPACEADPARAERVNVGGTLNVLEAAKEFGFPVLVASSKGAIGPITGAHGHPTYEPLSESATRDPNDVYGATKLAVEHYCEAYRRTVELDVTAVRFGHTYGPGKGEEHGSLGLIPQLIEKAARGERVTVPGGDQRHDFIYYADIGVALAAMIDADLSYGVYHLGSGQLGSLYDFQEALAAVCPDATVEVTGGLNFFGLDQPGYCRMDISRARDDFGFDPQYAIHDGVEDYVSRL